MAKFELTARICEYLDPHLTFPLLEFLCDKQVCISALQFRVADDDDHYDCVSLKCSITSLYFFLFLRSEWSRFTRRRCYAITYWRL